MMMYGWMLGILLLLLVIWFFSRQSFRQRRRDRSSDSPLGLLKKRYARGEINREEFEEQKRALEE